MKTISDFTIYCTEEQTKKAIELGAPIEIIDTRELYDKIKLDDRSFEETYNDVNCVIIDNTAYLNVTAEQMRGWLMDKLKVKTFINKYYSCCDKEGYGYLIIGAECILECDASNNGKYLLNSDKIATFAAINAALEYLSNNKKT